MNDDDGNVVVVVTMAKEVEPVHDDGDDGCHHFHYW